MFDAGYDMRLTAYTNPAKIDLLITLNSQVSDVDWQNLEKQLAQLATRKNIQDSSLTEKDKADGSRRRSWNLRPQ